jgi:hypothetical protein
MCLLYNSRQSGQVLTGRQKLVGLFEGSVQPPGALATAPPGFENVIHPKVGATSLLASLGTPPQSGCFRISGCLNLVSWCRLFARAVSTLLGAPNQPNQRQTRVSCLARVLSRACAFVSRRLVLGPRGLFVAHVLFWGPQTRVSCHGGCRAAIFAAFPASEVA